MKKLPVYIILFLYTAVQLKPVTAVLQDIMAHTFFKVSHMATVHYENGHYHLHKELKTISEEDQDSSAQKSSSEKANEITSPQQLTELNFNFNPPANTSTLFFSKEPQLLEGHTLRTFRPPSFA